MNRREFLRCSAICGSALALGNLTSSCAQAPVKPAADQALPEGISIIDAHAHPDQFFTSRPSLPDFTSTLKAIQALKMSASSFSAVGDLAYLSRGDTLGSPYLNTKSQLARVKGLADSGKVKLVLKAADVPRATASGFAPGAIMAIEGGDPLEGKPERVNEFHALGVRMITLVHYRNNELGDIMAPHGNDDPGPPRNGLTPAGRRVVERMEELGMVVDVAHAHPETLRQVAEICSRPIVDSHTGLRPDESGPRRSRSRTLKEMERVAKTGGVVCTWPLAERYGASRRDTFLDWAREILEMKKKLGIAHAGLGTDGGGNLPRLIHGYRDLRDLVYLIAAMREVGLAPEDIRSYMGGNLFRVLRDCTG